ncbi:hypothetical protein SMAC4_14080 [Sordaria macrospora]|uniref:uncharacterized protein n=1 Tax=Sordaria macrospora TaxID=5147 RepID=UPI002B30B30D|nr:hypothetical protein SMAC4_14080 [Sordaria macrospora]
MLSSRYLRLDERRESDLTGKLVFLYRFRWVTQKAPFFNAVYFMLLHYLFALRPELYRYGGDVTMIYLAWQVSRYTMDFCCYVRGICLGFQHVCAINAVGIHRAWSVLGL